MGVEKILKVNAFDVKAMEKALKECTSYDEAAVLIAEGECVFISRDPQPAYEVDLDLCTACGLCARMGCPAIVKTKEKYAKTGKGKTGIDPVLCTGCDVCRQICPTGAIKKPEKAKA
jgi:indolepyruvate ferredoxin oxidoreductase alpha subunit